MLYDLTIRVFVLVTAAVNLDGIVYDGTLIAGLGPGDKLASSWVIV